MVPTGDHFRYGLFVIAAVVCFKFVNEIVPDAYLDEVFHIPQTQEYCAGNWTSWDESITTPPGLYTLGVAYSKLMSLVRGSSELYCSTRTLRHLNLLGVLVGIPMSVWGIKGTPYSTSIALACYPLIAFFGLLYYTDVWSTVFVVLSLASASRGLSPLAAVLAGISVAFRQTNIVWAGFIAVYALAMDTPTMFLPQCEAVIRNVFTKPSITIPFGAVAGAFLAFVKWNGGVALGDKSNHQLNVNIPQLFYCAFFWALFSWPLWFGPRFIRRYIASNFDKPLRIARSIVSFMLIAAIIDQLTIVHAFMLADNRHYVFYLWRRVLYPVGIHEHAKYVMVPVYHVAIWAFLSQVYTAAMPVTATALIGAIAASIVPSPLLEPRYYIIPYVIWRAIVAHNASTRRLWFEWMWYAAINCVTVYVFLYKPFEWPQEPGHLQRFMW